jgi:hypothetical protein
LWGAYGPSDTQKLSKSSKRNEKAEEQLLASIIFYDGNQSETHKLGPICCEPDFVHLEFRPLGSVDDMRTPTACKNPAFLFFPLFSALSERDFSCFSPSAALLLMFARFLLKLMEKRWEQDLGSLSRPRKTSQRIIFITNISWRFPVTPHSLGLNVWLWTEFGADIVHWLVYRRSVFNDELRATVCLHLSGIFIAFFLCLRLPWPKRRENVFRGILDSLADWVPWESSTRWMTLMNA